MACSPPPFEDILKNDLDLTLPDNLVLDNMEGYCLHSDLLSLDLVGKESGRSVSVTRSNFDAFMLEEARKAGAEIVHNRVTAIEVNSDGVVIYTEGDNFQKRSCGRGFWAG